MSMRLALKDGHGHRQRARQLTGDRTAREMESEGGKEGERDREVDDRGSGLFRSRCDSPARTVAAVQTHKVRTHRQRTLASSSSVCAPQRKAACGLFTAHAAWRPTRVKGGRRTRLAAQDRPTPEGVGGKGLAPTHGASTQSTRQHATTPTEGEREGERTTTTRPMDSHRPRRRRLLS